MGSYCPHAIFCLQDTKRLKINILPQSTNLWLRRIITTMMVCCSLQRPNNFPQRIPFWVHNLCSCELLQERQLSSDDKLGLRRIPYLPGQLVWWKWGPFSFIFMPSNLVIPFCWFCFVTLMSSHTNLYPMQVFGYWEWDISVGFFLSKHSKPSLFGLSLLGGFPNYHVYPKPSLPLQFAVWSMATGTVSSPLIHLQWYNSALPLFSCHLFMHSKAPFPLWTAM